MPISGCSQEAGDSHVWMLQEAGDLGLTFAIPWCAAAVSAAKAIGTPTVLWIHDIMAKLEYCDVQKTQR
jgi:hypothetical protein